MAGLVGTSGTAVQATYAGSSVSRPVFCRFNAAEMAERKAKGLCFNCDETFLPGHRCKYLFYVEVPEAEKANFLGEEFDKDGRPLISALAVHDHKGG